jgi:hypothetical protein
MNFTILGPRDYMARIFPAKPSPSYILQKKEKQNGEHRTRRLVLEAWDKMEMK